MAQFVGKYKYVKDDGNFDSFLKTMNVSFMIRKMASSVSPTVEISIADDGTMIIKTVSTFKTSQIQFKLGEEFDETRMDDVQTKSLVVQDGNKLIHTQKADVPVEIIREFDGDKMIATCKCKDVVCVREYKKL